MKILPRIHGRAVIAYAHDIAMAAISFVVSLYLRLGEDAFRWDHWYIPRELQ